MPMRSGAPYRSDGWLRAYSVNDECAIDGSPIASTRRRAMLLQIDDDDLWTSHYFFNYESLCVRDDLIPTGCARRRRNSFRTLAECARECGNCLLLRLAPFE